MKKTYIKPEITCYKIQMQHIICTSGLGVNDETELDPSFGQ